MYTRGTGFLLLLLVRSRGAIFVLQTSLFLSISPRLTRLTFRTFEWFFVFCIFIISSPRKPAHYDLSTYLRKKNTSSVTFRVYRRHIRDAWRDVVAFVRGRKRTTSFSSSVLHPNVCQRPRILFRFSCSFSLFFFFLSSYFFSFFFPHVTRLFGSIAFYFNLVNPPFTAARNDSFPLEKARTNRLAILARIFSKFGSVVNVFRFI